MKKRKLLEIRQPPNLLKRMCAFLIKKVILLKILPEEEVVEEEEEDISKAGGANTLKEKSQIFTAYAAKEMDHMMPPKVKLAPPKS